MGVDQRRQQIRDAIEQHGLLTMHELADLVAASQATVRRDLRHLAESGLIRRTHGGAAASRMVSHEAPYLEKSMQAAAEKEAIAAVAAKMITDGDAIALGAGTTTLALARLLTSFADLTVVTNSMLAWSALQDAPGVQVILSGGLARRATHALVGPLAEQSLAGMYVSTVFISGNGLTAARGLSTPDVLTAAVDRCLIRVAGRVVVLADHTKVGLETMAQTVAPEGIDCIVTDAQADEIELAQLRVLGPQVVIAGGDGSPRP